jgi:hypothetical protein
MELTGEHRIPAPREMVWQALNDPAILKECITGCQRLEKVSDREMEATVQAKVGPVKATFEATVEIVDPVPPERYRLVGEGKGGVAGFAKGSADVSLAEDGDETILTYHASATIGGKLAQLGSRLVDTTAKKYAADFFQCLTDKLSSAAATSDPAPGAAMPAPADRRAPPAGDDVGGRMEPRLVEGLVEEDIETRGAPFNPPHGEDTIERELEVAAAKGVWGGPWFWGILAFAAVIVLLIALQ